MQGYCDVYKWTILKRTPPEVKCLYLTSSRREMCTLSVSNVIYHKFSHGAAFYTLNGKSVNVMLEFNLKTMKKLQSFIFLSFYHLIRFGTRLLGGSPGPSNTTYVTTLQPITTAGCGREIHCLLGFQQNSYNF